MILLECPETGERQLVRNAVGYRGWKLISRKAPLPPADHCSWCCEAAKWTADEEAQARAARLAAMRDPEALLAIIEDLTARIAALEAKEN
jgi:hypothetical protein